MRRATLGFALLAGCAAEPAPRPELHFDVALHRFGDYESVAVTVIEPDRPAAVDHVPFAHPGECAATSDVVGCDGACPGEWLATALLVHNGAVIAENGFDPPFGTGFGFEGQDLGGASLVITDIDGREVEIPLPQTDRPVPTIDDATRTEIGLDQERIDLAWSTTPAAASAVVQAGGGYGGPRCHEEGASGVTSFDLYTGGTILEAYVTAYAAPVTSANALGTVDVWVGSGTSVDLLAE